MVEPHSRTNGRIWLFDRRDHWRGWSRSVLEEAGFVLDSMSRYDGLPEGDVPPSELPDLVILACSAVHDDELALVERLRAGRHRILVLALLAPWKAMRSLFLAGAYDVTDMPASPQRLVQLVEQALVDASGFNPQPLLPGRARR